MRLHIVSHTFMNRPPGMSSSSLWSPLVLAHRSDSKGSVAGGAPLYSYPSASGKQQFLMAEANAAFPLSTSPSTPSTAITNGCVALQECPLSNITGLYIYTPHAAKTAARILVFEVCPRIPKLVDAVRLRGITICPFGVSVVACFWLLCR